MKNKLGGHLRSNLHKSKVKKNGNNDNVKILSSAFKNRIISYMLLPSKKYVDIEDFFEEVKEEFVRLILNQLVKHR